MSENTANAKKGTRLSPRILVLIVGAVICIVLLVFYGLTIGTNNTKHLKEAPVVHITASDNVYQELSNIPDSVPSGNKSPVVITDTPRIPEQNPREQSVVIANNNQTDYMKQLEAKMAQLKLQELQSAMNSSLTLQTVNNSLNTEKAAPSQGITPNANRDLLNFPADKSDYQASNMQSDKNDFLNTAGKSTQIYSDETATDQKYQYEVKAGTVIPAVLLTGINSDLPGQIIAKVRSNVFDSTTGKDVLIPQGSTLIGIYSSQISYGQSRCLMVWSRVIYPDGENLNLEGMPGADLEGYAGIEDEVNNHYWRIFGNAILMSIFTAGIELATQGFGNNNNNNNSNGYDASQIIAGALGMQLGEAGMAMVQKNMNIQPTIEIRPGNEFNILVTRDIAFKKPYTYKL